MFKLVEKILKFLHYLDFRLFILKTFNTVYNLKLNFRVRAIIKSRNKRWILLFFTLNKSIDVGECR